MTLALEIPAMAMKRDLEEPQHTTAETAPRGERPFHFEFRRSEDGRRYYVTLPGRS